MPEPSFDPDLPVCLRPSGFADRKRRGAEYDAARGERHPLAGLICYGYVEHHQVDPRTRDVVAIVEVETWHRRGCPEPSAYVWPDGSISWAQGGAEPPRRKREPLVRRVLSRTTKEQIANAGRREKAVSLGTIPRRPSAAGRLYTARGMS